MKITAVFHGAKVEGLEGAPQAMGANPPMSVLGMEKILAIVPIIRELGPYQAAYCSLVARAMCTMSVLAMAMGIRQVACIEELGQFGNLDKGKVIPYPGHENDNEITWQRDGQLAMSRIWNACGLNGQAQNVLLVSHRPIIGALVARTKGITDKEGISKIVLDPNLTIDGYIIFEDDGNTLSLVNDFI